MAEIIFVTGNHTSMDELNCMMFAFNSMIFSKDILKMCEQAVVMGH